MLDRKIWQYSIFLTVKICLDVVGHMKLVNGHSIVEAPVLDEVEIAKARRVLIHVQSHEYVYIIFWKLLLLTPITYVVSFFSGPVMKLYLWDQAARDFCKKFNSYEGTPTVLLVTTVNTKTLGGSDFYLWYRFLTVIYQHFVFFSRVFSCDNRYSGLDLNVIFACVYGLWCPTYNRLLQLVSVYVFCFYSFFSMKCSRYLTALTD